ncbi:glycosyl transferase group 1 [Rhodopirellula maiorica SM1]|uniref:Glycosyl transferase group 1 n=1 Tax=Rhodopirellula maiorica SM1 TaxID=1265738 RepID=M5RDU7_9BACT|nr:glycosyl transferase group 1 [Rhodopirellula maiorica SM1]
MTHVTHYRHRDKIFAYGPYVREINVWCDLFPEVMIAAPCKDGLPPGDGLAISRANVNLRPIPASGGDSLAAKLQQLVLLPRIVWLLCLALYRTSAVHVRCPGNLGLLGVILAPCFSNKLIAKYAGQWSGFPEEAWSVRLQRYLLGSRWWRGIVTVYGNWPNQPPHVIPFFTSVMTAAHIRQAKEIASRKVPQSPLSILFVGRLSKNKNADVLIKAVANLAQRDVAVRCDIVGDGEQNEQLRELVARLDLKTCVHFAGAINFEQVFDFYDRSQVLVLASDTEGWPKAIAEAMACGLVCVGSDRGLVPWMLGEGRGFVVPARDIDSLTNTLERIATSPDQQVDVSRRAAEFSQRYSLETLRDALRELLSEHWDVDMNNSNPTKPKRDCNTNRRVTIS